MTLGRLLRGLFRWIIISAVVLVAGGMLVGFFTRFGDGPMGPLPGGRLHAGEMVSAQGVDWSFVQDVGEVELQLLDPPRSRLTWAVVHGGGLYVPCGFVDIPFFKQWHKEAAADGRAVLRVNGRRYPVQAVRITDPTLHARISQRVARKYDSPLGSPNSVWIFRLDPRNSDTEG